MVKQRLKDYKELDGSIKKKVTRKLEELSINPFIGEALGNKFNVNLSGFYKIYVENKKYRIVYRIIGEEIEIVEIWGIGKRDKEEIYKIIGKRLKKKS